MRAGEEVAGRRHETTVGRQRPSLRRGSVSQSEGESRNSAVDGSDTSRGSARSVAAGWLWLRRWGKLMSSEGRSFPRKAGHSQRQIERWHKSLEGECIRPRTPLSLEDARRLVKGYVEHYNNVRFEQCDRLHHAKGHARRASAGDSGRAGCKLEAARKQRKNCCQRAA